MHVKYGYCYTIMMKVIDMRKIKYNDYVIAVFAFTILALFGSMLSVFNIITILTAYQLLKGATHNGLTPHQEKIIRFLLEIACVLTLCQTVLYLEIQL